MRSSQRSEHGSERTGSDRLATALLVQTARPAKAECCLRR